MTTRTVKTLAAQLLLAASAGSLAHGDESAGVDLHKMLVDARKATAAYTDLQAAVAAGYTKFPDQSGDCVAQPGQGGMGVHYLNSALLMDDQVDPLRPEFLVYRPGRHGRPELVALEYVVFAPLWDASHPQPPALFGHPFHLVRTPNRYGTPMPFYELHVWAWEHNPNGLFNDWNPRVSCD